VQFNKNLKPGLQVYKNHEIYTKNSEFISHLKERVMKWTGGDEKRENKQKEGEKMQKKFRKWA